MEFAPPTSDVDDLTLRSRWALLRDRLDVAKVDGLLLSGGPDLAFLTGYAAMPLERITAFVGRADDAGAPTLLVPGLECARVDDRPDVFDMVGWDDETDPVDLIAERLQGSMRIAVSNDLWAMHVLALQRCLPDVEIITVAEALGGIRSIKTPDEREALLAVGGLADRVVAMLQSGDIPLIGRAESAVAADIADRLLAVGHDEVQFVIVASGPNSASPHHHPGDRIIEPNEMVLCDFGGTFNRFNSDTTRCVYTGEIPDEVQAAYDALMVAQQAAVDAAAVGGQLRDVDLAARTVLSDAGYGDLFIHRTGHGIGLEVHEEPYVTQLNHDPIQVGHAFSIEPGVYIDGKWGMRLEDIVFIDDDGRAVRCNRTPRELARVG